MYLLYADEFGHDGVWNPAGGTNGRHPLFGLGGFLVKGHAWRDLDRKYLRAKQHFYKQEVARCGLRSERFEPKDLDIRSRRDRRFTHRIFDILLAEEAILFAYGLKKPVAHAHNSPALYGSVTQELMRSVEKYIRHHAGHGTKAIMVVDRRQESRDVELLSSAQSYLFSAAPQVAGGFDRLIEVPMLVRSEWHHGIQIADNICRVIGRAFRYRVCRDIVWKPYDDEFGGRLDELTHHIAPWKSVFVRRH